MFARLAKLDGGGRVGGDEVAVRQRLPFAARFVDVKRRRELSGCVASDRRIDESGN